MMFKIILTFTFLIPLATVAASPLGLNSTKTPLEPYVITPEFVAKEGPKILESILEYCPGDTAMLEQYVENGGTFTDKDLESSMLYSGDDATAAHFQYILPYLTSSEKKKRLPSIVAALDPTKKNFNKISELCLKEYMLLGIQPDFKFLLHILNTGDLESCKSALPLIPPTRYNDILRTLTMKMDLTEGQKAALSFVLKSDETDLSLLDVHTLLFVNKGFDPEHLTILIEKGALDLSQDSRSLSILAECIEYGRWDLVKVLRDHGQRLGDMPRHHIDRVFYSTLMGDANSDGPLIRIERQNMVESSYKAIMALSVNECKSPTWAVKFEGEDGIDVGGLKRELFTILGQMLFSPELGLFSFSAASNYTVHVHPLSHLQRQKWHLYKLVGRIFGMAFVSRNLLGSKFSSYFLKGLVGQKIDMEDLKDVDENIYNSAMFVSDNDPDGLDLYFVVDREVEGKNDVVELKEGGADIPVTEENKKEYLELLLDFYTLGNVQEQMDLIKEGFYEFVPYQLLHIMDWDELPMFICGTPTIDIDDWKKNTYYENCDENDPTVNMFWDIVKIDLNDSQRSDLLQFATGSPFVPLTGFKDLQGPNGKIMRFMITLDTKTLSPLIISHTCFNQLCIPQKCTRESMLENIMLAIASKEGFQMG